MSIKFAGDVEVLISSEDMRRLVTEAICSGSYGVFANLEAVGVGQTHDGSFNVILRLKTEDGAS